MRECSPLSAKFNFHLSTNVCHCNCTHTATAQLHRGFVQNAWILSFDGHTESVRAFSVHIVYVIVFLTYVCASHERTFRNFLRNDPRPTPHNFVTQSCSCHLSLSLSLSIHFSLLPQKVWFEWNMQGNKDSNLTPK